jgi:hypothetical protein
MFLSLAMMVMNVPLTVVILQLDVLMYTITVMITTFVPKIGVMLNKDVSIV